MGRWDSRIRFWNGTSWINPSRIQIWNGTSWVDYGTNDSYITKDLKLWNGSSWLRVSRNRQDILGDKYCFNNSGGYLRLGNDSAFNLNQNIFLFQGYVAKDSAGDRNIAYFGTSSNGWSIVWLADGRIRWQTRYNGTAYNSFSSNAVTALYTYVYIQVSFPTTGTGSGTMTWNGVNSTANRSGRHQLANLVLNIGTWGTYWRGSIRCRGINGSGTNIDRTGYINDLTVGTANQTAGNLSTVNTTVYQDTTTNWV